MSDTHQLLLLILQTQHVHGRMLAYLVQWAQKNDGCDTATLAALTADLRESHDRLEKAIEANQQPSPPT